MPFLASCIPAYTLSFLSVVDGGLPVNNPTPFSRCPPTSSSTCHRPRRVGQTYISTRIARLVYRIRDNTEFVWCTHRTQYVKRSNERMATKYMMLIYGHYLVINGRDYGDICFEITMIYTLFTSYYRQNMNKKSNGKIMGNGA